MPITEKCEVPNLRSPHPHIHEKSPWVPIQVVSQQCRQTTRGCVSSPLGWRQGVPLLEWVRDDIGGLLECTPGGVEGRGCPLALIQYWVLEFRFWSQTDLRLNPNKGPEGNRVVWAQRLKVEVVWVVRSIPDLCSLKGGAHSILPHLSPIHKHTHLLKQSPGRSSPSFSSLKKKFNSTSLVPTVFCHLPHFPSQASILWLSCPLPREVLPPPLFALSSWVTPSPSNPPLPFFH